MFGSALLRREGVRGFGFGIGCSGVIQMTQDGCRQVGIGHIGVGTVTVVTISPVQSNEFIIALFSMNICMITVWSVNVIDLSQDGIITL